MRVLLVLSLLVCACTAASFFDLVVEEWGTWKLLHGKNYSSTIDEKYRMKIFVENRAYIERHNGLYHQGKKSFSMKINHYGDMLPHEFRSMVNGYKYGLKKNSPHTPALFMTPNHVSLPESIDWRTKGYVTPVKNQGQCGSCWAFSTTGSLEGQHFRKTGKLTSLSEQNLVDCSVKFGNNGCEGGLMDYGFAYIKQNKGIDTEASYPYEGVNDKCKYDPSKKGAWDVGFVDVTKGDEQKLKEAVGTIGPVSVAIDASQQSFQFYHKGVYKDDDCSPEELDHGVLCVGYGVEETGEKYWLVKNSWATTWGDEGYIKMARDEENMCGIASSASYPLV